MRGMNDTSSAVFGHRWFAWLRPAPGSWAAIMQADGHSPWACAWNLLWSFWVFMGALFTDHVGTGFWWSLGLGYPLFLLIYLLACVRPPNDEDAYVGALVLLTGVSIPWNPAAWTYAVFACAMVPYNGSWLAAAAKMATIQVLLVLEGIFLHWPWYTFPIVMGVCTSTGAGSLLGRINRSKNLELRMSHEQIRQLAATAERERIGRDLHDLLGHTLSLITLKLELSRKLFDRDPAAAKRELTEAEDVARHALAEVRSAVTGIRAAGFAAELASAALLLRASGVQFDSQQLVSDLPESIECGLALVLREAATNIARHAHAARAEASIARVGDSVQLRIEDNGRGGVHAQGNGLRGMRERVQALGGSLRLDSPPGGGTRLCIEVPLPAARLQPEPAAEPVAAVGAVDPAAGWLSNRRHAT